MQSGGERREFEWQNNSEILRRRYGQKSRPEHHRVVLGPYAFVKGWLVSFGAWFVFSLVVSIIDEFSSPSSSALSLWAVVLMFSFFIAAFVGAPCALVLGMLLRPVRQQWLHVLAFAVGLAIVTWAVIYILFPGPGTGTALPAIIAAIAGAAAGVGRAAVIRDVELG